MTMAERQSYSRKELKQLNKNELCNMVLEMQEASAQKDKQIAADKDRIDILTQEVQLLRSQRFGRKSEQTPEDAVKEAMAKGQLAIDEALELIFNEERRAAGYEIWVDVYPLTRFLEKHKQQTVKVEGTREWVRMGRIVDPAVEAAKK